MSDIFEVKRFGLLLKKTILERPMQFMGLIGLVLIATLIIYSLSLYALSWQPAQNLSFIWGFLGGGSVLSSVVFGYFSTNASGSAYLTLPASSFEKWLCGVVIIGLFFPVVFLTFFRLMDTMFVLGYHNSLDKNSPGFKDMYDAVQIYTFDNNIAHQATMLYTNFAGAMMLGSLYFNKVSAVKTALAYCVLLGIVYFLNLGLANFLFRYVDIAFPFHNIFIKVGNDVGSLELPSRVSNAVTIAIEFLIPGMLWITALIRLREKEI